MPCKPYPYMLAQKKINKASFAEFFSEKISKLAKKNVIFFTALF